MKFASRIDRVPPYLFVEISRRIAEKRSEGADVISFGIGDPDLPTPSGIVESLREASLEPANHRYPETDGLPELRKSIARWYDSRFGVSLDADREVLPLIGAKEGIGHVALCFVDPGDIVLVPDPGYPVYSVGTWFAGGECHFMPLSEENGWLPDLSAISNDTARQARAMWLNYPNNPTGAVATEEFLAQAVEFARAHDIALLHDAAYTECWFEGYRPPSLLQTPGAMDVGMEFHSLSKSYNMTGWRVGMAAGNANLIEALMIVKSNLDSGIPQAVQHMAIEAIKTGDSELMARNAVYQRRRNRVVETLRGIGLSVETPRAGLYVWARVPEGFTSAEFAGLLLDEVDLVVTPGNGYGPSGEGYVRFSLTIREDEMERGLQRLTTLEIRPK